MSKSISKLETIRQKGKTQVEAQRVSILDAAETLFLEKGLENTNMKDIASQAGITRMSVYRYFPDRDPIAFEIAVRMLRRIAEAIDLGERPPTLEVFRKIVVRMIDQFYPLRDAYRYLGMFDHLYAANYPNDELAAWYKEQIFTLGWGVFISQEGVIEIIPGQAAMLSNATLSFLQKMAARGELMSGEQEVSLDEQLSFYKDMIHGYFDRLAASKH